MSKAFQRKDLKHDQFVIGAGRAGHWLMERRGKIGWAVIGVAVVLSVIFSVRFAHQRQEEQAAALLAAALDVYRAPVVPPVPEPAATPLADEGESAPADAADGTAADGTANASGDEGTATVGTAGDDAEGGMDGAAVEPLLPEPTPAAAPGGLQFATLAEKNNAAIERLEPIVERYGGRPSGRLAAYYLGICYSELGNTDAAITALGHAVEASAPLISDMALFRLGQLELNVGNAEAALQYFDRLLDGGTRLFPLEEALMGKARAHQDAGDPRAALATYQRVLNEFGGSYAAVEARARAEELSAELGIEMQEPGGLGS